MRGGGKSDRADSESDRACSVEEPAGVARASPLGRCPLSILLRGAEEPAGVGEEGGVLAPLEGGARSPRDVLPLRGRACLKFH